MTLRHMIGSPNRIAARLPAALAVFAALAVAAAPAAVQAAPASLHELRATDLEGQDVDLGSYRGKVVLVVNVASYCGYTVQYGGLEKLHREFAPRGFAVLGFPSNEFGGQEPGSPAEIRKFVTEKFGVTFPMFSKAVVKAGPGQSPVYAFLGASGSVPQWNFGKYLVGKDGKVIALFSSDVTPESPQLRAAIEKALAAPAGAP
jgi:glutathione peroxidase